MVFPFAKWTPVECCNFPLLVLKVAHFPIPNSILMSSLHSLTVCSRDSISLSLLLYNFKWSMKSRWLRRLRCKLYPALCCLRRLVIGIIAVTKSMGDSESPWNTPLLMSTSHSVPPPTVSIVFQCSIRFSMKVRRFVSTPTSLKLSWVQECGTMSYALL